MRVTHSSPFDHTLNTIGHGSVCWEGEILPDQPYASGHGFSGAEGFTFHNPWRNTRHAPAE